MKNIKNFIILFIFISVIWLITTVTMQRFKCSKLTETELFISIPNSFILDFKTCD